MDKNTSYDFKIDGNMDNQTTLEALDKIIIFLKDQQLNKNRTLSGFVVFDDKSREWKIIDVMKVISNRNFNRKK